MTTPNRTQNELVMDTKQQDKIMVKGSLRGLINEEVQ